MSQDKPDLFCNSLNQCVEKPTAENAQIICGFKTAGQWNYYLWLQAENDETATRFTKEKIGTIKGVNRTSLLSASPLELNIPEAKEFISKYLNVSTPNYTWTGPLITG